MLPQFSKSTFLEVHILYIHKSNEEVLSEIAEKIDKIRVESNFSIYELACRADTTPNTIKNMFRKRTYPNINTLCNICDALEIPLWTLFYKTEEGVSITKTTSTLLINYEALSDKGKRLLLELSENMR